jgi:Cu/Ag efflux protein CusF
MKRAWILAAALVSGIATTAAMAADAPAKAAAASLSSGEVRKVDREAKKVTIKHGPIDNLKMPPMTMVFRVKDAALLDGVEPGTLVRFRAEEADGGYLVTRLQKTKAK